MPCTNISTEVPYIGAISVSLAGRSTSSQTRSDILPNMYITNFQVADDLSRRRIQYRKVYPEQWSYYFLDHTAGGTIQLTGIVYSNEKLPIFQVNASEFYDIVITPTFVDYVDTSATDTAYRKCQVISGSMSPAIVKDIFIYSGSISYKYSYKETE